jgi:hypothetical protein
MDRYANMPGSAFEQSLSYISGKLDSIDRRTRYAGAVRATHPANVSVPYNTTTTIASLALNPGRWVVFAGAYLELVVSGSNTRTTLSLSGVQGQPAREQEFRDVLFDPGVNMSVVGTEILTSQTTVLLRALWDLDSPTGFDSCTAEGIYLIAMPA